MIKKLTEKLKKQKSILVKYNFEKNLNFAGTCPDCDGNVVFIPELNTFVCTSNNCSFEADENCERINNEEIIIE